MRIDCVFIISLAFLWIFVPSSLFAQYLPDNHYKTKNIRYVMETIGNATGSIRGVPELKVSKNKKFIAEYAPHSKEIMVSEGFYDFCKGFGSDSLNALACIVGHELGHYYYDHDYSGGFNEILGYKKDLKVSLENKKYIEAKADAFGLKYAYLGGFSSFSVYPGLLNKIYKRYKIVQNPGYPTKVQRIEIAADQIKQIKPLIHALESALFLQVNGYSQESWLLYDYLLKNDFISAEILNNMGAIRLSQALKLSATDELSDWFLYPCEIDPAERLRAGLKQRAVNTETESRIFELQEAEKYLRDAVERNPRLYTARLNLTTVFILKEEFIAAQNQLNVIEGQCKISGVKLPANYYLLHGICLTMEEKFTEAKNYMELAKSNGAFEAVANLQSFYYYSKSYSEIISNIAISKINYIKEYFWGNKPQPVIYKPLPVFETLKDDFSFKVLRSQTFDQTITNGMKQTPFYLNFNEAKPGITKKKLEFADKTFYLIQIDNKYAGVIPLGIKPGENIKKLEMLYGNPFWQLYNSVQNKYLVYRQSAKDNFGLFVETKNGIIKTMSFYYFD